MIYNPSLTNGDAGAGKGWALPVLFCVVDTKLCHISLASRRADYAIPLQAASAVPTEFTRMWKLTSLRDAKASSDKP